jgi:predicted RNA-binding protein with RPS1 domain
MKKIKKYEINTPEVVALYKKAILQVPEIIDNIIDERNKKYNYIKKWKINNPTKVKELYIKNKEKIKVAIKIWRKNNPEKTKIYSENYRKNNKEKFNARKRKYYERNRERLKEYQREYYRKNKKKYKQYVAKCKAKKQKKNGN